MLEELTIGEARKMTIGDLINVRNLGPDTAAFIQVAIKKG